MRFSIFTYIEHCRESGKYFSYGPYIREMNLWLKQVELIDVIAPLQKLPASPVLEAYEHEKIEFTVIPAFNFLTFRSSVSAVFKILLVARKVYLRMKKSDHIHLRCPGNVGLISCVVQIFFPSKAKTAKYAGNWEPGAKQPWTYNLQKWILSNTFLTKNIQVLVYGEWPDQSKNIRSFFTASFSEKEIVEARKKRSDGEMIFLFVGSLVEGKQPLEAIRIFEEVRQKVSIEKTLKMRIFGDGPEREELEAYCHQRNLKAVVSFKGNRPLEELKKAYQNAHFVILPSRSEGWPKAVAEGMFFGCIPIATPVSCVPWMLGYGSLGILIKEQANGQRLKANGSKEEWLVDSGQWADDIEKILELIRNPVEMQKMSEEAKKWSQQYTLEKFEAAIKEVVNRSNEKSSSPSGRGAQG